MEERYYRELLFAAVRGYAERIGKSICELSAEDEEEIVGFANGLPSYVIEKNKKEIKKSMIFSVVLL